MVAAVHAAAPDPALLRRSLAALQSEHAYWTSGAKQVRRRHVRCYFDVQACGVIGMLLLVCVSVEHVAKSSYPTPNLRTWLTSGAKQLRAMLHSMPVLCMPQVPMCRVDLSCKQPS